MNEINFNTLHNLPEQAFWLLFIIAIVFTVYFIYQSYKHLINARAIEDHPTSKIRSAAQGYVELSGQQTFFEKRPIIAPLTKEKCTWYAYRVEYYHPKGTRLIDSGKSTDIFVLLDETGECIVDPHNAEVHTPYCDRWFGFSSKPKAKPKSLLMKIISRFGRYRYYEWRMSEGMPLYAIGNFASIHLNQESTSEYQSKKKQIKNALSFWHKTFIGFLPSNKKKNSDKQTWLEQINQAHQKTNNALSELNNNATIHVISATGLIKRTPYILSAYNQKHLAKKYRLQSILWTIGYLIMFTIVGVLLFTRLS